METDRKPDAKIAVLLSTYNGRRYLAQQLDSLLSQSLPAIDIFIRDDGSTDHTQEIINEYVRSHPNIHLIADTLTHRGCGESFRRLAEEVDANYYLFCDQDDIWYHDKIERSLSALQAQEGDKPALLHTDLEVVDADMKTLHRSFFRLTGRKPELAARFDFACAYCTITGCTTIFNRAARDLLINAPKVSLLHDHLLGILVAANHGRILLLDTPTVKYRQHGRNVLGASSRPSLLTKLRNIRKSFIANKRTYRDIKTLTGLSPARYILYKLRYLSH